MIRSLLIVSLLLVSFFSEGQYAPSKKIRTFSIVFYNVENLFDTINDPLKNDDEFLPVSDLKWNSQKYLTKLSQTCKVLGSIDSLCHTALIGLAEVENINVLNDLVALPAMKKYACGIIFEEGKDPRGIDVAILYDTRLLTRISHYPYPAEHDNHTRFILYGKFLTTTKDTLHLLVNHWKSRTGGQEKTAAQRMESACRVRSIADSLLDLDHSAKIVIMGDLNDNPRDESLISGLGAKNVRQVAHPDSLYNLMLRKYNNGEGSLYYQGWDMFDQIIVSGSLLTAKKKKALHVNPPEGIVFKKEWMLYKNKEGIMVPSRTAGKKYIGGFSDHLPVFVNVTY